MVAAAIVGAGAIGAVGTIGGSALAANAQTQAAQMADNTQLQEQQNSLNFQQQMYNQTRSDVSPFLNAGKLANAELMNETGIGSGQSSLLSPLLKPFQPTESQLENTPGYQFNLSQGLKAVQNSNAARGLGVSGAAMRGAADYATGLADSTYQQQYSNYVTNQTNAFNRLMGMTQLGQNSALGLGAYGTQTGGNVGNQAVGFGSNISNNLVGMGNAQAGATMATANALGGFANSVPTALITNQLLQNQGMYGMPAGYGVGAPSVAGMGGY